MSGSDPLQRYWDAGEAFTQMTRERAEKLIKELVKGGEIQRKEAQTKVEELITRSLKGTEALVAVVRSEVSRQFEELGDRKSVV